MLTQADLDAFLSDPRTTCLEKRHKTSVHVALIVKRGKILAQAANKIGSRSRGCGWSSQSLHAEKSVVKDLGDVSLLKGADMYVMRISRNCDGNERYMMNSKPCHSCQRFLQKCMREYGLNRVYYTADAEAAQSATDS